MYIGFWLCWQYKTENSYFKLLIYLFYHQESNVDNYFLCIKQQRKIQKLKQQLCIK